MASFVHVTLHHRRHNRRVAARALGHLAPAMILVMGALDTLSGRESFGVISALEFGAGAAYLFFMVRELRHVRAGHEPHAETGIAWLEVAAAAILAIEGYHIWHRHHEAELAGRGTGSLHLLPWLYSAMALVYLALAFNMVSLSRRRYLRLDPDGFSGRLRPFAGAFHYQWTELAGVQPIGEADVLLRLHDGSEHRLSLLHLHHGARHRDELVAHAQAAGL